MAIIINLDVMLAKRKMKLIVIVNQRPSYWCVFLWQSAMKNGEPVLCALE